jgi:Flagellar hook-length control protein FliK
MNEVQPVGNELTETPKIDPARRDAENFVDILEKEKQKTGVTALLSANIQQMAGVPVDFTSNNEDKLNRINTDTTIRQNLKDTAAKAESAGTQTQSKIESSKKQGASNETQSRITQDKQTNNVVAAISKAIVGELELTPEFYNAAVTAKNRSLELLSVDVDDLVSQIKDKIKFLKDGGKIELSMQLKPDNMGTIQMNISSVKGEISINILAGDQAKDALTDNMRELERSLKNANLKIANINIYSRDQNNGEYS